MDNQLNSKPLLSRKIRIALFVLIIIASVFLVVNMIAVLWPGTVRGSKAVGTNVPHIDVTGTGDAFAVPDTATFSYSVDETGATVAAAQAKATTANNTALDYLKKQGIADKDIKTIAYNVNPQYDYEQSACPIGGPCGPGKQILTGYQVYQTIEVKVRDSAKAGDILTGIGSLGIKNISSLEFTVADEDTVDATARAAAISDAKNKATLLAKQLGVTLGKVTGYTENTNNVPPPIYGMAAMSSKAEDVAVPAPQLPAGQNKVTVTVNVTYSIY